MPPFAKALHRGLDILETLGEADRPMAFGELRDRLEVSPASYTRFVRVLLERGYLARDEAGQYRLGWRLASLGDSALRGSPLRELAGAHLDALVEATEESAEAVVFPGDGHFQFVDRRESPRAVVLRARPGSRFPNHPGNAIGLLGMATGDAGPDARPLDPGQAERLGEEGFAELLQNNDEVLRAAAVVTGPSGRWVGALVIAAPAFRVGQAERRRFRDLLTTHAAELSGTLGAPSSVRQGVAP